MPALLIALAVAPTFAGPSVQADIRVIAPKACAQLAEKAVKDTGDSPLPYKRLDELPKAPVILAVLRQENGCPVLEVRYAGRTLFVQPPARADSGNGKPTPLDTAFAPRP